MRAEQDVAVETARVKLQSLPTARVIDTRPRSNRPAVVELPEKRTHVVRHDAPQMLGADLDPFSLQDLTNVKKRFKVLRLRILAQHVFANELITARVFLMSQHHRRLNIAITVHRVGADCFDLRKGLKTIFAHEAGKLFFIFAERRHGVPDLPVVKVTHLLRFGISFKIRTG